MLVRVEVFLREGVLDAAGEAVRESLALLGYAGVSRVRVGKVVELDLDVPDAAGAEVLAREMAERLLANPVVEEFAVRAAGPVGPVGQREP